MIICSNRMMLLTYKCFHNAKLRIMQTRRQLLNLYFDIELTVSCLQRMFYLSSYACIFESFMQYFFHSTVKKQ